MLCLIDKYPIEILSATNEIIDLARAYLDAEIIPETHIMDAMHVATATVNNMDMFITYNFGSIYDIGTILRIQDLNKINGYNKVKICSPPEVIDYKFYDDICIFDCTDSYLIGLKEKI
jgi:hypothetical protein